MYGIITKQGQYVEVSATLRGAKAYATRHGYTQVAKQVNNHTVYEVAFKDYRNKWVSC